MKNWLLGKGLGWLGSRLEGYRTYLAAVGFILLGIVGCVGKMYPDSGLPNPEWEITMGYFTAGLGLFGVGKKIDKNTAVTIAASDCTPTEKKALAESSPEIGPAALG